MLTWQTLKFVTKLSQIERQVSAQLSLAVWIFYSPIMRRVLFLCESFNPLLLRCHVVPCCAMLHIPSALSREAAMLAAAVLVQLQTQLA